MARIRTIKPEFAVSESLAECSVNARLLFALMWCFCDDGGVHPDSPRRLKMSCFPADDFTAAEVGKWVDELVRVDCLRRYEVAGVSYLRVTHWNAHQKIDQPTFRYPNEDGKIPTKVRRALGEDSPNARRDDAERSPPEGKGRESKGKEKESPLKPPLTEPATADEDEDDGGWEARLSDVDKIRIVIWRQAGAHPDKIRSWLASANTKGCDRIAEWIKLAPPADILAMVGEIFQEAEDRGSPIGEPWSYLAKAIPNRIARTKASAPGGMGIDNRDPILWEGRRKLIGLGEWLGTWPDPDSPVVPPWARDLRRQVLGGGA